MAQDAAASGAQSDADSSKKGDSTDAGESGGPDVEKIVAARVAQKLKGYGDLDDLKRKATEYDKQQAAGQTAEERYQSRIAELEQRDKDREAERRQERVQTAAVREAARLGFRDPADAYHLLDTGALEFEGDAPSNVAKLLTVLLKEKPYLAGASVNGSADGGNQGDATPPKQPTMDQLIRAAAKGN